MRSEDFHTGLGILEANNLTFDLLLRPELLRHVPVLAEKFPSLKLAINHLAKPTKYGMGLEEWKEAVDKMTQKRKEVSAKLAGYAEMLTK